MEEDPAEVERSIQNLLVLVYTELTSLSQETPFGLQLEQIVKLPPGQAFDLITSTIEQLLQAQQEFKQSTGYQEYLNHEPYQKALQKLENEVRSHIQVEQQLKLYMDSLQNQVQKSECALESLKLRNQETIKKVTLQNKKLREQLNTQSTHQLIKNNPRRESQKLLELEKKNYRLVNESRTIQALLEEKKTQCSKLKEDNKKFQKAVSPQEPTLDTENSRIEYYKKKYEEKCNELARLQIKLKQIRVYEAHKTKHSVSPLPSTQTREDAKQINSSRSISSIKRTGSAKRLRQETSNPRTKLPLNTSSLPSK